MTNGGGPLHGAKAGTKPAKKAKAAKEKAAAKAKKWFGGAKGTAEK
jgi:hypothetical protein